MFKKILKSQKGQLATTDLIMIAAIITAIAITFFSLMTPTVEDTHKGLVDNVKTLKGGGI